MADQREKPDFFVDPSGNVQDARYSGYGSAKVPPGSPPSNGNDSHWKPHSSRQPKRTIYLIPIPIGLIIFLLVSLVRSLNPPEKGAHTFDSETAFREYSQGNLYLFSGDYDNAILYFEMALGSESDSADIHNGRGLAYRAKGDMNSALADFDRALELAPDSAMIYNNRAITYQDMGDYDQAIADLDRAIELRPNLGKAYYNRGIACLALGDYGRAIADLDQAIQRSSHWFPISTSEPSDSGFDLLSGFDEQLEAQRSAAPLPSAHYNRGLAYLARGEYDSAIADLREAIQLQPDLSAANYALTLAYAAIAQTPSALAVPRPSPTGIGWSTAIPRVLLAETTTAAPTKEPQAPVAAYVPQPHETPTTPIWDNTQVPCDENSFGMWVSPGRYLYVGTTKSGESYHIAVEQKVKEENPSEGQCSLPWLNYGDRLTESSVGYRRSSCGYDSSRPPGSISITAVGVETKRIGLGTYQAERLDTFQEYHFPYPKFVNDPQGSLVTSEWYVCGYGLICSRTSHTGKYQGRDFQSEYGLELVSFTPLSTNESHVRYIIVDNQLGDLVAVYRANTRDEETAEALRRWNSGIRVVNIEEFERKIVDRHWQIVYAGTEDPILGTDVILTTDDSSQ